MSCFILSKAIKLAELSSFLRKAFPKYGIRKVGRYPCKPKIPITVRSSDGQHRPTLIHRRVGEEGIGSGPATRQATSQAAGTDELGAFGCELLP